MATEKVSLTLDEELVAEARERAGARGLSGYVNRALRHQLQRDRLAALSELAYNLHPWKLEPGVTKFRSLEEADRHRRERERRQVGRGQHDG